jgi:redox-sensitive bicupin YhaK (pirin superfamily)
VEADGGGRADAAVEPVRELLTGHEVALGGARAMTVTRTLPNRGRRMVGAWCFADAYGPTDLESRPGMLVPPHPHTSLQTVSWLLAGEVLHRDSLGNEQLIRPGQLNLMTAGRGIAHSEQTPQVHSPSLHGVQLWAALPADQCGVAAHFEHHEQLPVYSDGGVSVTVVMGEMAGVVSPAHTYTPLLGADVVLPAHSAAQLPLRPDFEYAALALAGTATVDGVDVAPGPLLYLGTGRTRLPIGASVPARLLLLGGEPFAEQIVMWWNFVGRSHEDIVLAREDWMSSVGGDASASRFPIVPGYQGSPLPAPELPFTRLKARGRER